MPLSPVAMLILRRQPSIESGTGRPASFHDYNADIALQCYEFIVCVPGRRGRLGNANIVGTARPFGSTLVLGSRHRRRNPITDG